MKRLLAFLFLGLCISAFSCATVIARNLPAAGDGWKIAISEVSVSQNSTYPVGQGHLESKDHPDEPLVWVNITITNQAKQKRTFDYKRLVLSAGDIVRKPTLVDRDAGINIIIPSGRSDFDPEETLTRNVIFPFPKGKRPASIKIPGIGEVKIPKTNPQD